MVVRDIFKRTISTVPAQKGILFNGTPKMIGEAKLVARLLKQYKRSDPIVIYINIPLSEVMQRAKKRRIYADGKIIKRHDDTEAALHNRRRYYKNQVSRVVAFFKKKYAFKNISGLGSRAEVRARIIAAINSQTP